MINRKELCSKPVTLNGHKAVITGSRNDYATVTDLVTNLSCEWSWEGAEQVISRGGKFKS